jgi:hypothetical protein
MRDRFSLAPVPLFSCARTSTICRGFRSRVLQAGTLLLGAYYSCGFRSAAAVLVLVPHVETQANIITTSTMHFFQADIEVILRCYLARNETLTADFRSGIGDRIHTYM